MKTPEELFTELVLDKISINHPVMDNQRFPWRVFWFSSNGKYICDWEHHNEYFNFHYGNVWKVFDHELNLNYYETQETLRGLVEKHFGLRGVTLWCRATVRKTLVEEHFKNN